jgi:tetratricopeptide (TPR) repeat protein
MSRLPALLISSAVLLCAGLLSAAGSENMAERTLKRIVERQREIFATASKAEGKFDEGSMRTQLQGIVHEYELLLRDNPSFAAGYAAYGYLLGKVDMRKESAAMLLKANQLDPDIPLVKNQLGNFMAEDGKPLQAAPYFLAAIKLEPSEPLYHYQLASLLAEARDTFLKSGEWTRPALDGAMLEGFRRAHELAPDRFEFAYRYAESFYDLEKPDWELALKLWSALEDKATTPIERQTMRLHAANILIKLNRLEHARALLASVDVPELQGQKQRLVPQLEAKPAK